MKDKVKIEIHNGINIFYRKDDGMLEAKNKKTGEVFKGKYLFEIKRQIDDPVWEDCKLYGIVRSGYFDKELFIVKATRQDTKNNNPDWIVFKDTRGYTYNIGKKWDLYGNEKHTPYPMSKKNVEIYKKVKLLQENIAKIENEQRLEVAKLKHEEEKK